ncbi:MAG: hypothetical protein ACQEQ4_11245 [Fibrobacterota bacterium]
MSRIKLIKHQVRKIPRYHFEHCLSNEKIGLSLRISKGSIHNTLQRFGQSVLSWPLPSDLTDSQLEELLNDEYRDASQHGLMQSAFYRYCRGSIARRR